MIIGYGRVSTMHQTVEPQLHEMNAAGYPPDLWFADIGLSGLTPAESRPELQKALSTVKAGDTFIVTHLDRIGRDVMDIMFAVRRVQLAKARVVVLQFPDLDLNTSMGEAMMVLSSVMARLESESISKRTRSNFRHKLAKEGVVPQRRHSKELEKKIVSEYPAKSMEQLQAEYGVSRWTISRYVKAAGKEIVTTPRKKKEA